MNNTFPWAELTAGRLWTNGAFIIERIPGPTGPSFPVFAEYGSFAVHTAYDLESAKAWCLGKHDIRTRAC